MALRAAARGIGLCLPHKNQAFETQGRAAAVKIFQILRPPPLQTSPLGP